MKKILFVSLLLFLNNAVIAAFHDHFYQKSLRLDYFRTGDSNHSEYSFDEIVELSVWGGPQKNLLDTFHFGEYRFVLKEESTGIEIFSKGFTSLFWEWQQTSEAKLISRTFSESIVFPYPKSPVVAEFYERDKTNKWVKKWKVNIDPGSRSIRRTTSDCYIADTIHYSGPSATCTDLVLVADGYSASDMKLLKDDLLKAASFILNAKPWSDYKHLINIWGIAAISAGSGIEIPGEDLWKESAVGLSFYTFGEERYLMTRENKKLQNIIACTPCDAVIIIGNSAKYGGGGIYNLYAATSARHSNSDFVLIHELGHSFSGLADEYYSSSTPYIDYYDLSLEPWEPNITTLKSFDKKWKNQVQNNIQIPTPAIESNKNAVGVYEGGGYMSKGVYRPMMNCTMHTVCYDNFCPVCQKAIQNMILFTSDQLKP